MDTLFKVHFNWGAYLGVAIVIAFIFPGISLLSYIALMIAVHQFMLLFFSFGYVIPMRYLLGSFMCLQMFVGPSFAYLGLDQYQRGWLKMQIPANEYFTYVIPAVIMFILGLHVNAGKLNGEVVDNERIKAYFADNPTIAYVLIGVGFVSSIISQFFASDVAFVFYLLGGFKFIGLFLIIIAVKKAKPLFLALVYGSVISSSIGHAMFHDLLTWLIFLGAVYAIKYKPSSKVKALFGLGFLLLVVAIQLVKGDYRKATWRQGEEASLETLTKTYEKSQEKNTFVSMEKLGASNVRINQGFIITNIMSNVPARVPHANGLEMLQIVESAVLPRVIAPNKLNAGDREIFMKWSGMRIAKGTSMGLSSVGDAYINFGMVGGSIFMFFYGMFFSAVLNIFYRASKTYPLLILFTPLAFYYPIRPDCETQTILGHLIKCCFLIFVIFQVWKHEFKLRYFPG